MAVDKLKTHLKVALPTLGVLVVLSVWAVRQGDAKPTHRLAKAVEIMGRTGLSAIDEEEKTAGYYEGLLDSSRRTVSTGAGLLSSLGQRPAADDDWENIGQTDAVRRSEEFIGYDLKPDVDIPFKGDRLKTNRWGQRDKDYELEKPPGTWRIAMIGTSITMGSGVPVEKTFQALLEDRLNQDRLCPGIERYEVINFSVPGHRVTQEMEMAIERALPFQPDVVLFTVDYLAVSAKWSKHIAALVKDGRDLKYDFLKELAARCGLKQSDNASAVATKVKAYRAAVAADCIREVKHAADAAGSRVVLLALDQPKDNPTLGSDLAEVWALIADLGIPLIDALDAFRGHKPAELQLSPSDAHPNALGHQLLFESVYRALQESPSLWAAWVDCGSSAS